MTTTPSPENRSGSRGRPNEVTRPVGPSPARVPAPTAAPRGADAAGSFAPFRGLVACLAVGATLLTPPLRAATAATNAPTAPATTPTPTSRALSLHDCVQSALARNFDIQLQRLSPKLAELRLHLGYAAFDPNFSVGYTLRSSSEAEGIDSQNRPVPPSQSESDNFNARLNGSLPVGMTYTLSGTASDTYGTSRNVPFERSQANWTAFELRQQLLRNAWIDETRVNLRLRRKDIDASRYALAETVQTIVARVEQAYFDLVANLENVRNSQKALELAERLFRENQRRVQIGTMADLEEKEAQSQMASSQAALIAAQASTTLAQQQLRSLLTDQYETEGDLEILPTDPLDLGIPDLDFAVSRARALELRPDLKQLAITVEQRQLSNRLNRNQLLPQLELLGNLGYVGAGSEFSGALGTVSEGSAPFHTFGATLSFPLSNRRARTTYRMGQTETHQAEFQLRRQRQAAIVEVDDAIVRARSAYERVGATREARQYAEAALAAEEKKLKSGRSTSFVVLQIQQRLTAARLEELRAQTDYNKSLSTLRLREGRTLEHHRIELFDNAPLVVPGK